MKTAFLYSDPTSRSAERTRHLDLPSVIGRFTQASPKFASTWVGKRHKTVFVNSCLRLSRSLLSVSLSGPNFCAPEFMTVIIRKFFSPFLFSPRIYSSGVNSTLGLSRRNVYSADLRCSKTKVAARKRNGGFSCTQSANCARIEIHRALFHCRWLNYGHVKWIGSNCGLTNHEFCTYHSTSGNHLGELYLLADTTLGKPFFLELFVF